MKRKDSKGVTAFIVLTAATIGAIIGIVFYVNDWI